MQRRRVDISEFWEFVTEKMKTALLAKEHDLQYCSHACIARNYGLLMFLSGYLSLVSERGIT